MHLRAWILLAIATLPAVLAEGCSSAPQEVYSCTYPVIGRKDAMGQPDPCCEGTPCPGTCLFDPCPDGSVISDGGTDGS